MIARTGKRIYSIARIMCIAVFILLLIIPRVELLIMAPIYWNSSNPVFKTSSNSHMVTVNLHDEIDFVCPYYSQINSTNNASYEYYVIYQVSHQEYEDCSIYPSSSAKEIVNCSNPFQRRRFTLLFEKFQAIPNAPEYNPGQKYYYITVSTGDQAGLSNTYQGACYFSNMKILFDVCCETSSMTGASSSTAPPTKLLWPSSSISVTTFKSTSLSSQAALTTSTASISIKSTLSLAAILSTSTRPSSSTDSLVPTVSSQAISTKSSSKDKNSNEVIPNYDRFSNAVIPFDRRSKAIFILFNTALQCFLHSAFR